ncbi:unnamed protein product [Effrenium voratum]|nr:unnamed protein product [Effrenium voratum]
MIAPDSQLAEMGLVPQEDASGLLAHVDAVEAFLCRARVRLRLGDGGGARADAASARGMACQLGDLQKQESAESFLLQAGFVRL